MKRKLLAAAVGLLLSWPTLSLGYEPDTHAELSDVAAQQSVLFQAPANAAYDTTILQDLGLKTYRDVHQTFFNAQSGQHVRRGSPGSTNFEAKSPLTIQQLIRAGAELEDEDSRALNHFYDPVNNQGLTLGLPAPSWAANSGCGGDEPGPYDPIESSVMQCFSLQDALSYFKYALIDADPAVRARQFGDLFLTLGHLMHLVQDMAQPQHVRNDPHCDSDVCKYLDEQFQTHLFYSPSLYESFAMSQLSSGRVSNLQGYPIVSVKKANSFWTTGVGTTVGQRQGLADFTNLNFVSVGTNFTIDSNGNPQAGAYQNPVPVVTKTTNIAIDQLYDSPVVTINGKAQPLYTLPSPSEPPQIQQYCVSRPSGCMVSFVDASVTDYLNPTLSQDDPYASSYSIFDQDLTNFNECAKDYVQIGQTVENCRLFTLNNVNYAVDTNILLPRAVGYSAGLINYFFRGRLDVQPDTTTPGNYVVTNVGTGDMKGTLQIFYDAADGNRYPVPETDISVNLPAASNGVAAGTVSLTITPPTSPAPASSNTYMAVFKGLIGQEEGVAGKQFKIENSYVYLSVNPYDSCLEFDTCYGSISKYDSKFELKDSFMANNDIYGLAVYDGNRYTIEAHDSYVPSENCNYILMKNGVEFASTPIVSTDYCPNIADQETHTYNALGVNTSALYVFESDYSNQLDQNGGYSQNYLGDSAEIYDHDGKYLSRIGNLPVEQIYQAGVNDTNMCLVGWKDDFNALTTVLTDIHGTEIKELPTDPYGGAYCALTKDRIYQLNFSGDSPVLNEYDLNTLKLINSITVSKPLGAGYYLSYFQPVADDSKIYIPIMVVNFSNYYSHQFIVYHRTINSDGSETLTRESPDVTLPNYQSPYFYNYYVYPAVDMNNVLPAPEK